MDNKKNKEDNKLFELYTLAELAYQNHFKSSVDNIEDLYPIGWYENNNYMKKIEIITEAIKSNLLIENTLGYKSLIEGVVLTKKNQ